MHIQSSLLYHQNGRETQLTVRQYSLRFEMINSFLDENHANTTSSSKPELKYR